MCGLLENNEVPATVSIASALGVQGRAVSMESGGTKQGSLKELGPERPQ